MKTIAGYFCGLIFGLGLVISGMINPQKVQNFLDLAGTWDASLAFVMGGALVVTFIGYRLALSRQAPFFAPRFALPTRTDFDLPLLGGAALFGVGWGLGGYCPGPALTALGLGAPGTLIFVPALFVGLWIGRSLREMHGRRHAPAG